MNLHGYMSSFKYLFNCAQRDFPGHQFKIPSQVITVFNDLGQVVIKSVFYSLSLVNSLVIKGLFIQP
jgi:hypothetical protein